MDPKDKWRQTLLAKRQQCDPHFVAQASQKVQLNLFSLEEFNLCERLGLYAAFKNEVETAGIFTKAHAQRKEIYYPAVDLKTKKIEYYRIRNLQDLNPGYAGIPEPKKRAHSLGDINYLSIIIVPGVAFDKKGNRIGFGQGFYDGLLQKFNNKKIALAYEFQICDSLPVLSTDQRVDVIVTEERILRII